MVFRTKPFCDGTNNTKSETCGYPIGLSFNYLTGRLYACDPYIGLVAAGFLGGAATTVLPTTDGVPYHLLLAVDVAIDGKVYFTDASAIYGPRSVSKSYTNLFRFRTLVISERDNFTYLP